MAKSNFTILTEIITQQKLFSKWCLVLALSSNTTWPWRTAAERTALTDWLTSLPSLTLSWMKLPEWGREGERQGAGGWLVWWTLVAEWGFQGKRNEYLQRKGTILFNSQFKFMVAKQTYRKQWPKSELNLARTSYKAQRDDSALHKDYRKIVHFWPFELKRNWWYSGIPLLFPRGVRIRDRVPSPQVACKRTFSLFGFEYQHMALK